MPVRHAACKAKPIHVMRALSSLEFRMVRAYDAIPQASENKEPNAEIPCERNFQLGKLIHKNPNKLSGYQSKDAMNQAHALHTTEAGVGELTLKKIQITLASKHHFGSDTTVAKSDCWYGILHVEILNPLNLECQHICEFKKYLASAIG